MKKRWQVALVLWLVIQVGYLGEKAVAAEEEPPLGFSVETVQPKTQIQVNKTYFYIKTKPAEEQVLEVKIKGLRDEPVKVGISLANAFTSEQGTLGFLTGHEVDQTLLHPLEELVTIEPAEVAVAKNETKVVQIKVTPPAESYPGIKLASLFFTQLEEVEDKEQLSEIYRYGIHLMTSETEEAYDNGQTLELGKVQPYLLHKEKVVIANLHNPEPKLIDDLTIKAEILDAKTQKVLKTAKLTNGRMAPNSNFDFSFKWGIDGMLAGDYLMKMEATSSKADWQLSKEFTIDGATAKKLNEETLVKLSLPKWVEPTVAGMAIVYILLVAYLVKRQGSFNQQLYAVSAKRKGTKKHHHRNGSANSNRRRGGK